jgi:thioesterase domain-containing protein
MNPLELERYLHNHLPLTRAMQVFVVQLHSGEVMLGAPLLPNINHQKTVFGGSAATLATTAAWTLVHTQLRLAGLESRVVIQRNTMEFALPMMDEFTARAFFPQPETWPNFVHTLKRRKRARITVFAELACRGRVSGQFQGEFVAFSGEHE